MKRSLVIIAIFTTTLITLIGCSNEVPKGYSNEITKEFDLKQLTRIDVQIFTGENIKNEETITDKEKIKVLREVFARIEWEYNVKAKMARKEDVKATLVFMLDNEMPERFVEYFIWFNEEKTSATIIDREKNALGTLDKEDARQLKDLLMNN